MDELAFNLIILTICGVIAALIAGNKGRSAIGWFFGGFLLGILGIIIVAVLPNLKTQREKEARAERENRRLREQLRQEQLKSESFRQHTSARLDAHDNHMGLDTRHTLPEQADTPQLAAFDLDAAADPTFTDPADGLAAMTAGAASPPPPPAPKRRRQWHYELGGEQSGPVDESRLLELVRAGDIDAQTLLWTEGFDDWRPAGSISGLRPHLDT